MQRTYTEIIIQVAYFCILIGENLTETAVTYTLFFKKMWLMHLFNTLAVSTVLKASVVFFQSAPVVLSHLSFPNALTKAVMVVLGWC